MPGSTSQIQGSVGLPILELWNGASYDAVAELTNIEPNTPTVGAHETTNTDITDNRKTYIPGWVDEGEVSATLNYREDTKYQLDTVVGDGLVHQWRISWTDPGVGSTEPNIVLQGFITSGPKMAMPLEDRWTLDVTIKISGKPVFTRGG